MYVPIEGAFFTAVISMPGLFAEALDHNVVLITNSTMLATLRTVSHVWRLVDQQKHVLEIADRGGKLYDKVCGFVEDLQEVGNLLGKARKAWEDASTKLHTGSGNLISQTEKLKQLGAKAAKSLPTELVDKSAEVEVPTSLLPPTGA
jgi:DNA recombination protein RmuC